MHSARACFIENLAPVMTPGERAVLDSWYSLLTTDMDMEVDLVIYLRTSPQVALTRVQGRSRDEEMQIPGEFFTNMHQLHEVSKLRKCYPEQVGATILCKFNFLGLVVGPLLHA